MEKFWIWDKVDAIYGGKNIFTGMERCAYFEKDLWFELVNSMWCNHRSNFQDHVKYIHNDIVNPFRVGIIQYAERILEINNLYKYLHPPSMKHGKYDEIDWAVHYK